MWQHLIQLVATDAGRLWHNNQTLDSVWCQTGTKHALFSSNTIKVSDSQLKLCIMYDILGKAFWSFGQDFGLISRDYYEHIICIYAIYTPYFSSHYCDSSWMLIIINICIVGDISWMVIYICNHPCSDKVRMLLALHFVHHCQCLPFWHSVAGHVDFTDMHFHQTLPEQAAVAGHQIIMCQTSDILHNRGSTELTVDCCLSRTPLHGCHSHHRTGSNYWAYNVHTKLKGIDIFRLLQFCVNHYSIESDWKRSEPKTFFVI